MSRITHSEVNKILSLIQLAQEYDPKIDDINNYWCSYKYDGVRSIYALNNLVTRNGKILNISVIEDECKYIQKKYKLTFIDGELWTPDSSLGKIVSLMSSNPNELKYHIFLVTRKDLKNTYDMISLLREIEKEKLNKIRVVNYFQIKEPQLDAYLKESLKEKFEGLMLRHPIVFYAKGRTRYLLKVKPYKSMELKIVGFEKSENHQTLGAMICVGYIDGKHIQVKVGNGLSDSLRSEIWNNKNKYLNKIIEVKYQDISQSMYDRNYYSLRSPIFLRFRPDIMNK